MIPKSSNFVGKYDVVPILYAGQQGRSASFSTAQTNRTANAYKDFLVTRVQDYAVGGITTEAVLAGKKGQGSVVETLDSEMKTTVKALKRSLSVGIWGNKGGKIGVIDSISTTTVTLTTKADIVNFEVGQILAVSNTDGTSGSLRDSGNTVTVTAVNRNDGKVTTSVAWATAISGATAGDSIFVQGDFGAKMTGISAWIPPTEPSATTFFGVDRTVDTYRLAGARYSTDSGGRPAEVIYAGLSHIMVQGGRPRTAFINPLDFNNLVFDLGGLSQTKVAREKASGQISVFYTGIEIMGPYGPVSIIPDESTPKGYVWVLNLDSMKFKYLEELPYLLDLDGNQMRYESDADAVQWRYGFYGNLIVKEPGENLCITL